MGFFGWLNWFFRGRCRFADVCPSFNRGDVVCNMDFGAEGYCGVFKRLMRERRGLNG